MGGTTFVSLYILSMLLSTLLRGNIARFINTPLRNYHFVGLGGGGNAVRMHNGHNGIPRCIRLFAFSSTSLLTSESAWEAAASKGHTLVIVESPAKAKIIQTFLDPALYTVDSCVGHVRDLPKTAKDVPDKYKKIEVLPCIKLYAGQLGVDVFNDFEPIYVPLPGKDDIIKRLTERVGTCSRVLLASDEDREGEAIAWHLVELLQPKVPIKRAVFHEITKQAILDSFAHPRYIDLM